MMLRWIKCMYAVSILFLWIFSIITLTLSTVIRDSLSTITLVTEDTGVGDFYLKVFFPVIFPIVITVSCFIFVIGCVGYCGVFTNSQTLLGWFFLTMLVTFCVELSAGVWRIIEYDLSYNETDINQLKTNIQLYAGQESTPVWFKNAWSEIHQKFSCCGAESFQDWLPTDDRYDMVISCCVYPNGCADIKLVELQGCGEPLLSYMSTSKYIKVMPYITGIMGVIQVATMILTLKIWMAFCVNTNKRSKEAEVERVVCLCEHDKESSNQIEMKNRNGHICYFSPLTSYKDMRPYQHSFPHDAREVLSQNSLRFNRVSLSGADGVAEFPGTDHSAGVLSSQSAKRTSQKRKHLTTGGSLQSACSRQARKSHAESCQKRLIEPVASVSAAESEIPRVNALHPPSGDKHFDSVLLEKTCNSGQRSKSKRKKDEDFERLRENPLSKQNQNSSNNSSLKTTKTEAVTCNCKQHLSRNHQMSGSNNSKQFEVVINEVNSNALACQVKKDSRTSNNSS